MEQFIQNMLIGIRQWVNEKIAGVNEAIDNKQDILTAGDNIEITSAGTISVTGIVDDSVVGYNSTYSSSKILDLVNAIAQFKIEVVDALPESGMTTNTIYLVPSSNWNFGDNLEITFSEKNNERDEYLWIIDESTGEGRWELIGSTQISLADYYTAEEVNHLLDEKQNEVNVTIAEVLAVLNGLDERVTALENR